MMLGAMMPYLADVELNHPEDAGSKVLQNVGIQSQYYTASQPRRLQLSNCMLLLH